MAEPEFGEWLANELVSMLEAMLEETELRAFCREKMSKSGRSGPTRAKALDRLLRDSPNPDFIFAVATLARDEDLFACLSSEAWTVHVGAGPTRGSYVVTDFLMLRRVLELLIESPKRAPAS